MRLLNMRLLNMRLAGVRLVSMRFAVAALATLIAGLVLDSTQAHAQADPYRWCAQYGGRSGGTNCYFMTIGQCQAAVSGVGGILPPQPVLYRQRRAAAKVPQGVLAIFGWRLQAQGWIGTGQNAYCCREPVLRRPRQARSVGRIWL